MLDENDLSATSILSFCGPTHSVVAERDTVELKKYVADREARLARTWHQIASRLLRPLNQKKSPARHAFGGEYGRIGEFLRYTRIDALPQIVNVLRGEMSLIDPAGDVPSFLE